MMERVFDFLVWVISDPDLLGLVLTSLISLLAIWLSYKTLRANRMHNTLSSKPHLDFIYYHDGINNKGLELSIVNVGLGPAIDIVLKLYDEGRYVETEQLTFRDYMLGQAHRTLSEGTELTTTNPATLKAGQEQAIVRLKGGDAPKVHTDFIQRFKFEVTYCSLYGEKFTIVFPDPI